VLRLTDTINKDSHTAREPGHLSHSRRNSLRTKVNLDGTTGVVPKQTDLLCVNEHSDAKGRDEREAEHIVVIVVQTPQDDTRNLEYMEQMYDLQSRQPTSGMSYAANALRQ
jgi:hypothetical protein